MTSGATAISVRAGQRGVELVHDGRLDPELVEWLFHCESEADCPAAIRSLASGGALAVGVRSLSLRRRWIGMREPCNKLSMVGPTGMELLGAT